MFFYKGTIVLLQFGIVCCRRAVKQNAITVNVELSGGATVYLVEWWQLFPQTDPRPWRGEDGEPERYETRSEAESRVWELLQDEEYRHLAFRVGRV